MELLISLTFSEMRSIQKAEIVFKINQECGTHCAAVEMNEPTGSPPTTSFSRGS
jgi:hypothetical protein